MIGPGFANAMGPGPVLGTILVLAVIGAGWCIVEVVLWLAQFVHISIGA